MSGLRRYRFAGGRAVVTGAAGGIGEQLAYGLARRGSDLVLLDRDGPRLDEVAATIRARHPGVGLSTVVVDLADPDALAAAASGLRDQRITLLVNNAGVVLGGRFEQLSLEEFDWVLAVNLRAPVALTHHLLPALLASPGSHLVNVSSLFGLIGPAGQSAYCTSKFALRGFSDVLRAELAQREVGVTVVHPGGIRTRIADSAPRAAAVDPAQFAAGRVAARRVLTYPPEKAAERILDAVHRRRGRVLIAWSAWLFDLLSRLSPAGTAWVLARVASR